MLLVMVCSVVCMGVGLFCGAVFYCLCLMLVPYSVFVKTLRIICEKRGHSFEVGGSDDNPTR